MPKVRLPDHISPSWTLLVLVAGFIVYGSLFPFNFQSPEPFEQLYANLNPLRHRSDVIVNFLLFIPLGVALYFRFDRLSQRIIAAVFFWIFLGVLLQIAQLYLPGRVASLTDSFWNALGLITGLLSARLLKPWLHDHAIRIQQPHDRFALILCMAWLIYESFPFVPTLDIAELRNHTKTFFYAPPFEWMRLWQHLLAAMLGTLAALRAQLMQRRWSIITATLLLLVLLEILVPYGNLRRETLLGICLGIMAGERLESMLRARLWIVVMIIGACAYLTTILLPFRGQVADGAFTFTPFALLLRSENTEAVSPTAFEVLAIGSLLWAGISSQWRTIRQPVWLWPLLLALLLLLLEGVRTLLMGFRGDTTPLIILATLTPFALPLQRHQADSSASFQSTAPLTTHSAKVKSQPKLLSDTIWRFGSQGKTWLYMLLIILTISLGLWVLIHLPGAPYNLRELFGEDRLLGCFVFTLVLLWLGVGPCWTAHLAGKQRWPVLWLPFWLFITTCISQLLLQFAVTTESLNDITGSPDLYRRIVQENIWGVDWQNQLKNWPSSVVMAFERTVRFTALYWLLLIPLTLCALLTNQLWHPPARIGACLVLFLLWWGAKWIVVDAAITDNLTELIAPDGIPYLGALLLLMAIHANLLSHASMRAGVILFAIIGSSLSLLASWWLINQGLETVLFKYGNVFSAVQFLLGANRNIMLTEEGLFLRWTIVFIGITSVIAIGMRLAQRLISPVP